MTHRQFYDWQTAGGGGDVMLLVQTLEQNEIPWCMIGGLAVNHWAIEPMATADVGVVIATERLEHAVSALEKVGFKSKRFDWSINLTGVSSVSIQISTEAVYAEFPERSLAASVHGILMRVASLQDTLKGTRDRQLGGPGNWKARAIGERGPTGRTAGMKAHLGKAEHAKTGRWSPAGHCGTHAAHVRYHGS